MTGDEAKDLLLDIAQAVQSHRADTFDAYRWKDLEQMVIAMDIANERLWDRVLGGSR